MKTFIKLVHLDGRVIELEIEDNKLMFYTGELIERNHRLYVYNGSHKLCGAVYQEVKLPYKVSW